MGDHRRELDRPVVTGVVGVFVVGGENPNRSGLHDVCSIGPNVHGTFFCIDFQRDGVGKQLSVDADSLLADFYRVAGGATGLSKAAYLSGHCRPRGR